MWATNTKYGAQQCIYRAVCQAKEAIFIDRQDRMLTENMNYSSTNEIATTFVNS